MSRCISFSRKIIALSILRGTNHRSSEVIKTFDKIADALIFKSLKALENFENFSRNQCDKLIFFKSLKTLIKI